MSALERHDLDGLPAPLVPASVDLRAYDWFPLKHKRLRKSAFWARASDTAKAISLELWCEAYEQVPAGSVPDDDHQLSDWAGYGRRDLTQWLAVKAEVMSAWVRCSDGRWYHPTLCEVALESWLEREGRVREHLSAAERKRRERDDRSRMFKALRDRGIVPPWNTKTADLRTAYDEHCGATVTPLRPDLSRDLSQGHADACHDVTAKTETVTETEREEDSPPLAPSKPSRSARGTRLPADWKLSEADLAYAAEQGFNLAQTERIAEVFADYWRALAGGKGVKLDWSATWRNWVRREAERKPPRQQRPGQVDWC